MTVSFSKEMWYYSLLLNLTQIIDRALNISFSKEILPSTSTSYPDNWPCFEQELFNRDCILYFYILPIFVCLRFDCELFKRDTSTTRLSSSTSYPDNWCSEYQLFERDRYYPLVLLHLTQIFINACALTVSFSKEMWYYSLLLHLTQIIDRALNIWAFQQRLYSLLNYILPRFL